MCGECNFLEELNEKLKEKVTYEDEYRIVFENSYQKRSVLKKSGATITTSIYKNEATFW
jgi:hypothetical protein